MARALSKLGFCSRSKGRALVEAGRVQVNGVLARHADEAVDPNCDRITVDGKEIEARRRVYLMLNKPRGLVTTVSDEQGRATVFECFSKAKDLPRVFPVGRLDKASEGLLLFSNDTDWAARVTDPESGIEKIYHVQIDCVADEAMTRRIETGVHDAGEILAARRAIVLRRGEKNSWLEIALDEGRNRHIRRLLDGLGVGVLRLVRVSIGPLELGSLAKGAFRKLSAEEAQNLIASRRQRAK